MINLRQFLITHGMPFMFGAVLLEQVGLPLPAFPWLLVAGALCAAGTFGVGKTLAVSVLACLVADALWFYLGRLKGSKVLAVLCRISLEPDSCVRRTQNMFSKHGWRGLLVVKFVPGLSTVAPPLAAMSGMSAIRFLIIDSFGSALYTGCFIGLGCCFADQLDQVGRAILSFGSHATSVVIGLAVAYVALKYWQRKRLLEELRMARISAKELGRLLKTGQNIVILDMRSKEEFTALPGIEGSIHLSVDDVQHGRYKIPRDGEVVVYCSCPNEVTAARVALLLRRNGFTKVRPLLGGIDAWKKWTANPVV